MKWKFCTIFLHNIRTKTISESLLPANVQTLKTELSTKFALTVNQVTKNQVTAEFDFIDFTAPITDDKFITQVYNTPPPASIPVHSINQINFNNLIPNFNWKKYDSVFVVWPAPVGSISEKYGFSYSDCLRHYGPTYAAMPCNSSAISAITKHNCQFFLHEWLHGASEFFRPLCQLPFNYVENKTDADCGDWCGYIENQHTSGGTPVKEGWKEFLEDLASANLPKRATKTPKCAVSAGRCTLNPNCGIPLNLWGRKKPSKKNEFYAVDNAGNLFWYGYKNNWVHSQGMMIGNGWGKNNFKFLINGGNGVLYAIKHNGELLWYKHTGVDSGENTWEPSGKLIGGGWNGFTNVFSVGFGILYGILPSGELKWYRHLGYNNGANSWHSSQGATVGSGWNVFISVFAIENTNSIYGVMPNGDLYWYRHDGYGSGVSQWLGPNKVGAGWNDLKNLVGRGDGEIFGILHDGSFKRYIHSGYASGANSWVDQGAIISNGWQGFQIVV